jgi:hypothetical protein
MTKYEKFIKQAKGRRIKQCYGLTEEEQATAEKALRAVKAKWSTKEPHTS